MKTLRDSGLAPKKIRFGVKLLGKGDEFKTPVTIEVSRASKGAIEVCIHTSVTIEVSRASKGAIEVCIHTSEESVCLVYLLAKQCGEGGREAA